MFLTLGKFLPFFLIHIHGRWLVCLRDCGCGVREEREQEVIATFSSLPSHVWGLGGGGRSLNAWFNGHLLKKNASWPFSFLCGNTGPEWEIRKCEKIRKRRQGAFFPAFVPFPGKSVSAREVPRRQRSREYLSWPSRLRFLLLLVLLPNANANWSSGCGGGRGRREGGKSLREGSLEFNGCRHAKLRKKACRSSWEKREKGVCWCTFCEYSQLRDFYIATTALNIFCST